MSYRNFCAVLTAVTISFPIIACEPRVKVEAPDKPIVINLNVKIEHEVRVRVEKDLDQALSNNPGLF
ncbi:MAG: YnbE family lipoprotein [Rhodospirillales bacterium]|nr:YnbE family lipoprotein [Rhodospirillales bacterium]MBO6788162.1 YnbE family lipoprotein [Rhodospirillales bacterium]